MPGAGMIGDYTAPALGRLAAIFGVLGGYIVLVSAAGAMESVVAGMSMNSLWDVIPEKPFALFLLIFFLAVNLIGVKLFGKIQFFLTVFMMLTLVALGTIGIAGIGGGIKLAEVQFNPVGWGKVSEMLAIGIWLYIGIEYVCPMAEEIKNPQKNIPKAMIIGLVLIFVADMIFGIAALLYVTPGQLLDSEIPQLVGAKAIAGQFGFILMTTATVLASASSIDSHLAAIPRMLYGLSREGMLPKIFGYIHPRFRTPWFSIFIVFACLGLPLLFSIDLNVIMTLILIACITWLITYIMAQVNVVILRNKYPDFPRKFKTPLYPVPQIIGILACIYMIVTIHPDPAMKLKIWLAAAAVSALVLTYGVVWLKFVKKLPLFTPVSLEDEVNSIQLHSTITDNNC